MLLLNPPSPPPTSSMPTPNPTRTSYHPIRSISPVYDNISSNNLNRSQFTRLPATHQLATTYRPLNGNTPNVNLPAGLVHNSLSVNLPSAPPLWNVPSLPIPMMGTPNNHPIPYHYHHQHHRHPFPPPRSHTHPLPQVQFTNNMHIVWILDCKSCGTFITNRGMKVRPIINIIACQSQLTYMYYLIDPAGRPSSFSARTSHSSRQMHSPLTARPPLPTPRPSVPLLLPQLFPT